MINECHRGDDDLPFLPRAEPDNRQPVLVSATML